MNIGIVVYSETGNTLSLCEQAKEAFEASGHSVTLTRLLVRDIRNDRTLVSVPSARGFDLVVLGTPVQGFSLPEPVVDYLSRIDFPAGQRIGILVTQYFLRDWLGGTRTVRQAVGLLARFHPDVYATGIVHWRSKQRAAQIAASVGRIVNPEGRQ